MRSDLEALQAAGRVIRVHGAAMPVTAMATREESVDATRGIRARAKTAIGEATARTVQSGQLVFLDAGSTCDAVALALVARWELDDVTVVTNSLTVAMTLEPAIPRLQVIVTGGTLRPLQHSLVNPFAAPMLEQLHLDVAVIGCTGVDAQAGVTNVNLAEAEIKRSVLESAARGILVADAAKLGFVDHAHVAHLADFDALVTAGEVDESALEAVRQHGVDVVRADR